MVRSKCLRFRLAATCIIIAATCFTCCRMCHSHFFCRLVGQGAEPAPQRFCCGPDCILSGTHFVRPARPREGANSRKWGQYEKL